MNVMKDKIITEKIYDTERLVVGECYRITININPHSDLWTRSTSTCRVNAVLAECNESNLRFVTSGEQMNWLNTEQLNLLGIEQWECNTYTLMIDIPIKAMEQDDCTIQIDWLGVSIDPGDYNIKGE